MIRVHCELCSQHFDRDEPIAVLQFPNKRSPEDDSTSVSASAFMRWFSGAGPEKEQHHLCEPCARALWSLVEQMRHDYATAR